MSVEDKAKAQFDVGTISQWTGFFKTIFDLRDRTREACLPAIVKEYDRASHVATVIPLTQYVYTDGKDDILAERPDAKVRVLQFFHGGFLVDAPVYRNDTGILIAGDRCAETAVSRNSSEILSDVAYGESDNEGSVAADFSSVLSFENGFFIPCSFAKFDATEEDELVVFKKDGFGKFMKVNFGIDRITVERNDGEKSEKYTFGEDGLKFDGEEDRTISVVTDLRYDIDSHQVQKKTVSQKVRGDFVVGVSGESGWTMIDGGQAVPESE